MRLMERIYQLEYLACGRDEQMGLKITLSETQKAIVKDMLTYAVEYCETAFAGPSYVRNSHIEELEELIDQFGETFNLERCDVYRERLRKIEKLPPFKPGE